MRELTRADWEAMKKQNENFIIMGMMQDEMARRTIALCDEKIAEFPEEIKIPTIPTGCG